MAVTVTPVTPGDTPAIRRAYTRLVAGFDQTTRCSALSDLPSLPSQEWLEHIVTPGSRNTVLLAHDGPTFVALAVLSGRVEGTIKWFLAVGGRYDDGFRAVVDYVRATYGSAQGVVESDTVRARMLAALPGGEQVATTIYWSA